MKNIFMLLAASAVLFAACAEEEKLQYYVSPDPYETVSVQQVPEGNEIRNIIFMIGDGMGLEQVSCAWTLNHGKLNLDNFPVIGLSRTYSANRLITDSAAGGTALAIGQKTKNSHVGTDIQGNPVESILVKARKAGKKTGVAVTCILHDATPADFCCHNIDRYEIDDIVADYLDCGVDYVAGGGLDYFREKRQDGRDIAAELEAQGVNVRYDIDALEACDALPMMGILSGDNLPVSLERGDLYQRMVAKGLKTLSEAAGENGFVMMLEGSCIDDWEHENRIDRAMEELFDFDRAVGQVLKFAEADGHTLVVVTADHSTGSLTLQDGNLDEGKIGVAFGSEGHNGIAVPYYVYGAGASQFGGIMENAELGAKVASLVR